MSIWTNTKGGQISSTPRKPSYIRVPESMIANGGSDIIPKLAKKKKFKQRKYTKFAKDKKQITFKRRALTEFFIGP